MGIFKRLKTIATADLHEVLDKMEDPIAMLKQHLRDMEVELENGEQAVAKQIFFEKKHEALITQTKAIIEKRVKQAQLALKNEDEQTAKLAVLDKVEQESKLKELEAQLKTLKAHTVQLIAQVEQHKATYQQLKNKKQVLMSRAHVAQVTTAPKLSFASFTSGGALRGFERAEERILELEAKAQAQGLFSSTNILDLTTPVDLELEEKVQKELEALRQA